MITIETEVEILASPARIWRILIDLEAYRNWHPGLTVSGNARKEAMITLSFSRAERPFDGLRVPARITEFSPPRFLSWRFGIPRLAWIDEWFLIDAEGAGCRVQHGFVCSGWLSRPVRRPFVKRAMPFLELTNAALAAEAMKRAERRGGDRAAMAARSSRASR